MKQKPRETNAHGSSQEKGALDFIRTSLETSGGTGKAPPGSRAGWISEQIEKFRGELNRDLRSRVVGDIETAVANQLERKALAVCGHLVDAIGTDDAAAVSYEKDVVRRLVGDIRKHLLRHHMMLIEHPRWDRPSTSENPNGIFFSGNEKTKTLVTSICARRGLQMLVPQAGKALCDALWENVWSCAVCIVAMPDMLADRKKPNDEFAVREPLPEDMQLAEMCFMLGIARSLGKPVVVLIQAGQKPPFDIDVVTHMLAGDGNDENIIEDALDAALYASPKSTDPNCVSAMVDHICRISAGEADIEAHLEQLNKSRGDAGAVRSALLALERAKMSSSSIVITPVWPPVYAEPDRKLCFHIMPFHKGWPDKVRDICKKTCKAKDVKVPYLRDDEAKNSKIIHSIWEGICRATHVLVDLTEYNPNVAYELAIARTLGKNILVLCQEGTERMASTGAVPMLSKDRIKTYCTGPGYEGLAEEVRRFVSGSSANYQD